MDLNHQSVEVIFCQNCHFSESVCTPRWGFLNADFLSSHSYNSFYLDDFTLLQLDWYFLDNG
jgi:hypothetical protein